MVDVSIVGAGLAGLQLARLLAGRGVRVALIDRRRAVSENIRTTGIFVRRTFDDFELLHPFLGPPVRRVGIHSPGGRSIEIESRRDEFRVARMAPLYEAMLAEAIAAGVAWMPATSYEGLEHETSGVRVSLRTAGVAHEVMTRYVVGADGARSRVAADLRLDRNHDWIVGLEDVFSSSSTEPPRLDCWVDPAIAPGYLAWVADDGRERHVGVGGRSRHFDPASALRQFSQRFPLAEPSERRGGLIPVNGVLRRIACERGLLVGDAAGAVSPLTAGGLDACMRMSELAADVLIAAVRVGAPIRGFDGSRFRARFASRLASRRLFDTASRSRPLIELGFAAASTPLFLWLVRHVFYGRGSFPDVTLAVSSAAAGRRLRDRGAEASG